MAANLVPWVRHGQDLNMEEDCSGAFPPTPSDLRRYAKRVTRKGVGSEDAEFMSVLEGLMADDKHGEWRSPWQVGASGGAATVADCCYVCS